MSVSSREGDTSGQTTALEDALLGLWRLWSAGNTSYVTHQVNLLLDTLLESLGMPKKNEAKPVDNGKFYWVNVAVTDEDIPNIDLLFPTPEVTFRLLTSVLADNLKVGFSVNARNDMTVCSLSDRREGSPTFGACLTGAADGWYDALCVCLYKFTALLHGDLANGESGDGPKRRIM